MILIQILALKLLRTFAFIAPHAIMLSDHPVLDRKVDQFFPASLA